MHASARLRVAAAPPSASACEWTMQRPCTHTGVLDAELGNAASYNNRFVVLGGSEVVDGT